MYSQTQIHSNECPQRHMHTDTLKAGRGSKALRSSREAASLMIHMIIKEYNKHNYHALNSLLVKLIKKSE